MLVIQARLPVAEGKARLDAVRSVRDRMGEQGVPALADEAADPSDQDLLREAVDDSAEAGHLLAGACGR